MQFEQTKTGNASILKIFEKRLNAKIAVEFKDVLSQIIEDGNLNIILDMQDVEFIDSSGIGAIVTGLKRLGRRGDIVISNVADPVMQMFSLTRMDKVFRIFKTQQEAAASFGA